MRLTHKIMAIGLVGLMGLVALGSIYLFGNRSQEASRSIAENARTISDLNRKLALDMLEARRAEKDFQLRRDQSYSNRHAELASTIVRDLDQLKSITRVDGFATLVGKVDGVASGFGNYTTE